MNVMEDLKAYLDGELSPEQRAEVESALERDEKLRRELEELRVLSRLIGDCVVQPEPVGLEQTLKALAKPAPGWLIFGRRIQPMRYVWVAGFACALALAALVTIAPRSHDEAEGVANVATASKAAMAEAPAAPKTAGEAGDAVQAPLLRKFGQTAPEKWKPQSGKSESDPTLQVNADDKGIELSGRPETVPPVGVPQQLIRTADLSLRVANVRKAQADATNAAKSLGGFVESSSSSSDEFNLPTAMLTLRVPEKRFEEGINRLRALGEVKSESMSGEDVTAQVADTEARLKVMKAEEDQYVTLLRGTRKIGEILEVKDRLSQVRQEIESLDATRKTLRKQAAYSTISLTLSQVREAGKPEVSGSWADEAWANAVNRVSAFGRWAARVGMNLLVFAPFWLPVVLILWWLGRRSARR